jgi:3-oxoacyl-[acyl-carrier protein] reductase
VMSSKVVVVTGGAQGIGEAIATRFGALGAAVAVLDLDQGGCDAVADAVGRAGGQGLGIATDVSDEAAVEAAFETIASQWGAVEVLVNNAGVIRDNLLYKMSASDWDSVMSVHLRGAFLCARAAARSMVEVHYGRIVNMSSRSAFGNRGQANYSSAKAGLQGFTRTLAIELGPFGISVNAIAPGFIETAMTTDMATRSGTTIEAMRQSVAQRLPVRRHGVPDDIVNAVEFLASERSGYITGQTLQVDGGRTLI